MRSTALPLPSAVPPVPGTAWKGLGTEAGLGTCGNTENFPGSAVAYTGVPFRSLSTGVAFDTGEKSRVRIGE